MQLMNGALVPGFGTYIGLKNFVDGRALEVDDFELRSSPEPTIGADEVLVQTLVLSVDPALRDSMSGNGGSYNPQFTLDGPIHSRGVARVIDSNIPEFRSGDLVKGRFAWAPFSAATQDATFAPGTAIARVTQSDVKLSHHLGALGNTGDTAFFGVVCVAKIRPSDTVVVSGAAGGVGSIAGQIAKILGARTVVGIAGTDEKCKVLVDELGFDYAINYATSDISTELRSVLPAGPTVYFDNVGGQVSQSVMGVMPRGGRVVECGQISTYDEPGGGWNMDIRHIHMRGLRFEGFARTHFTEFMPAATSQLAAWLRSGQIRALETERFGLEALPSAFVGMLRGENIGKMVVTLSNESSL